MEKQAVLWYNIINCNKVEADESVIIRPKGNPDNERLAFWSTDIQQAILQKQK
jgi:hypothetical protein